MCANIVHVDASALAANADGSKEDPYASIATALENTDAPALILVAEGDYVITSFVRTEVDSAGETYYTTWFDMFRIEDGKIAFASPSRSRIA